MYIQTTRPVIKYVWPKSTKRIQLRTPEQRSADAAWTSHVDSVTNEWRTAH